MLFKPLGTSRLQRVQGAYVGEEEIALIVEQCRAQRDQELDPSLLEAAPLVSPSSSPPQPAAAMAITAVRRAKSASHDHLRLPFTEPPLSPVSADDAIPPAA